MIVFMGPSGSLSGDVEAMRKLWLPWWEENKDRLIDMGYSGDTSLFRA